MYQQSAPCVNALSPLLRVLTADAVRPFLVSTQLSITILRTYTRLAVCIKKIMQTIMAKSSKQYVPAKCSMRECAFPFDVCATCKCNASVFGRSALKFHRPDFQYYVNRINKFSSSNYHD